MHTCPFLSSIQFVFSWWYLNGEKYIDSYNIVFHRTLPNVPPLSFVCSVSPIIHIDDTNLRMGCFYIFNIILSSISHSCTYKLCWSVLYVKLLVSDSYPIPGIKLGKKLSMYFANLRYLFLIHVSHPLLQELIVFKKLN